jgi:hypothetical protein
MDSSSIAARLIFLPRRFSESGIKSFYTLLKETGYLELKAQVDVQDIREALSAEPKCISEWMQYSENKRCSSGWYFKQEAPNKFIVGYLGDGSSSGRPQQYTDSLDACATFIKHEIDNV